MKLNDFIKEALVQIMQGVKAADSELKDSDSGSIYKDSFNETMAQTLVKLSIVRGNEKKPVLIVQFDVTVEVKEQKQQSKAASGGLGAQILSVVTVKAGMEKESAHSQTSSNTHRITFSVPVSFEVPD